MNIYILCWAVLFYISTNLNIFFVQNILINIDVLDCFKVLGFVIEFNFYIVFKIFDFCVWYIRE